jgi:AraC family transcriptional activator of pyochelin receptor
MDAVEFRGNPGDLERFASHGLKHTVTMDQPGPFEHRIRWDAGGRSGFGSTAELRSGIKLSATRLGWDQPWGFGIREAATPLKFMLGRGEGPRMNLADGTSHVLGGGVLQVRHTTRVMDSTCEFVRGGADFEQVALEIAPERMRELLGTTALPPLLESLLGNSGAHHTHEQPMTPALARLLDEVLSAEGRNVSRQLFLEAKGLELLAVLTDELVLASQAASPLGPQDIERLERARRLLRDRMDCPPSLPELARAVGLNEFKLKAGFRAHFGTSVFGLLRTHRMDQARRLLVRRELSVTEVAARVGYENPSKFAAAFRKHFGFPPSASR